ncbi:hypothetical protein [Tepidibacter mesophilus]|nr:hypothetical protein [Tepidibacter mesophilus]
MHRVTIQDISIEAEKVREKLGCGIQESIDIALELLNVKDLKKIIIL